MRMFLLAFLTVLIVPLVAHAQPTRPVPISSVEITEISAAGFPCTSRSARVSALITPESPTATIAINCDARGFFVDLTFELSENSIFADVELAHFMSFEANITVDVPQAGAGLPIIVRNDSGTFRHPDRIEGTIGGTYPVTSQGSQASAATLFVLPGDRVTFFRGLYNFFSPPGSVSFSTLSEQVPEVSRDEFDGLSGDPDLLSGEVEILGSEVDEVDTLLNAIEELPMIRNQLEP